MKVFWNDGGRGPEHDAAIEVDFAEADRIWTEEVRGMEGNFFGLIDDQDRTIQFYFDKGIPDHVDNASHLKIVLVDFPEPERQGSYSTRVTIGEVRGLIEAAFRVGADHRQFGSLRFTRW